MRLWSIHPHYLDRQGLLAVWREGLLAQKVLIQGEYKLCSCINGVVRKFIDVSPVGKHRWGYVKCRNCKGTTKIKTPYYNHPQLLRFKQCKNSIRTINYYLRKIWEESVKRKYNFDINKIKDVYAVEELTVTTGQLEYEFKHLQNKLFERNKKQYIKNKKYISKYNLKWGIVCDVKKIEPHPLFKVVKGDIESWEKIK